MNIFNIKNTDIKIFCNKIKVMKLYNQGDVDGDNLSTSKYSYSPPKFSAPTTSNLAALLQHHHPAVAMVEKDSRLSTFQVLCRYLHMLFQWLLPCLSCRDVEDMLQMVGCSSAFNGLFKSSFRTRGFFSKPFDLPNDTLRDS